MKKRLRIYALLTMLFMIISMIPHTVVMAEEDNQKIVCIDPGHQRHANLGQEPIGPGASETKYKVTGGATGCVTHVPEYKLVLRVSKKLRRELKNRGYKVIMTRTTHDVDLSNSERAKIANNAGADVFIRIHANSDDSSSVKGALTCAPSSSNRYLSKRVRRRSQKLSKQVLNSFCAATGARNRGVMYTDAMSGINWCTVPVTIMEMGFMSNPEEDRLMEDADYQDKMVKGMADGIDTFLGNS
ncbi:MAG: N-acetylmuramoyl-L-alanine amidase [Eubacterium sp.]|nr:N-acetylmuramoyl-L-alanine amidase [Eubacterium sp.]